MSASPLTIVYPSPLELYRQGFATRGPRVASVPGLAFGVCVVVSLAVWIGLTVRAVVNLEDQSDPASALRTFAIGAGVFLGFLIASGVVKMLQWRMPDDGLYERLAVRPGAQPRTGILRWMIIAHFAFVCAIYAAMVWAVSQGEEGPFGADAPRTVYRLVYFVFLAAWGVLSMMTFAAAAGLASRWFDGLGLSYNMRRIRRRWYYTRHRWSFIIEATGTRHGHHVVYVAGERGAKTAVYGDFSESSTASTTRVLQRGNVKGVVVHVEPTAVVVERAGRFAQRFALADLQLAESLTGRHHASPRICS